MKGILVYNEHEHRPDIALESGQLLGGLHCGEYFHLSLLDQWQCVRLELDDTWKIIAQDIWYELPYGTMIELP